MTKQIPPGYKQTKVGVIPEDWDVVKIGDVCDCIVPGRNKPVNFDGNIPWVTTPDITTKYICDTKSNLYITIEEAKKIGSKVVPKNSVIMSCVGELGLLSIVKKEIVINQQLHAFIPSSQVNTEFLHYVLGTQKKYMDSVATKTAVPYMNKDNCNSIPIPLPKVKEQEKIAEILSTWDEAIIKQEQLIGQKQIFKKGIMQQIFNQKIRFKDDNGNDYPAWQSFEFEDIFMRIPSKKHQINSANYKKHGKYPVIDQGKKLIIAYSDNEEKIYKNSSIIVFGDHTRELKYVDFDFIVGADGTQLIKAKCNFDNKFLYYQLLTKTIPNTGYNRHFKFLLEMVLEVPSNEEQNKIADFITSIDDQITKQTLILDQLKLQKQALMQKLLTGQVRIKS